MNDTVSKMIDIPKNFCQETKSAVKTVQLGQQICKEIQKGTELEDIVRRYLPAISEEKLQTDVQYLKEGVQSVYDLKEVTLDLDSDWITQHLNTILVNLGNKNRVIYINNAIELIYHFVELDEEEWITEEDMDKISDIKQKKEDAVTDDDVALVLSISQELIAKYASVLTHNTVMAIDKMIPYLSEEAVKEMVDFGIDTSLAYALSYYIIQQCGETPWKVEGANESHPYTLGAIAAANVEESKLVAWYCKGKITLKMLHEKLQKLLEMVSVFFYEKVLEKAKEVLLGVVSISIIIALGCFICFKPWLFVTCVFSIGLMSCMEIADGLLENMWNMIKKGWNLIFAKKEIKDVNEVVIADVTDDMEEDDDIFEEDDDTELSQEDNNMD